MTADKIAGQFSAVREECPLVHCITNYVTVNDVANAVLAIGASPIMADDINEAADIASIASALVINMGTLNQRTVDSMLAAAKAANKKGIPVVFDPVGAGASAFRNDTAKKIMDNVRISILRGNLSEMSFMAGLEVSTKGVDTSAKDEKNDPVSVAKAAAEKIRLCSCDNRSGRYDNRRQKSRSHFKRASYAFKGNRNRLYDYRNCRRLCRLVRGYVLSGVCRNLCNGNRRRTCL